MKTIGLICEGVSEINIVTRIVSKYLDDNFKNKKTIQDCAQYHYGFNELAKQLDAVEI